jgi:hypothetical protein
MPKRGPKADRQLTRRTKLAITAAAAVAAMGLGSVYLLRTKLLDRRLTEPASVLEPGWQFYTRPTSLEPPGSIFRIDGEGRRFAVSEITPTITTGNEVFGAQSLSMRTTAHMLARFVGGHSEDVASQQGERVEALEFQMFDVQKEVTTDLAIEELLEEFRMRVDYRRDNRYFIIRETRSALALQYSLSEEFVNSLQGTAGLARLVTADSGLSYEKRGSYVLNQKLPSRMRVMFLAEELVPAKGLATGKPQFETVPVTQPLVWR